MKRKKCNTCGKSRSVSKFGNNRSRKDGLMPICKDCKRDLEKRVRAEKKAGTYKSKCRKPRLSETDKAQRKEEQKQYQKKYRQENKEELRLKKREYERRVREEGILEYGGKCSCCGESEAKFLTLEHLNGRSSEDRATGYKAWARLKRLGWPKGYTVLCWNCNCAKGIYGVCPHQTKSGV